MPSNGISYNSRTYGQITSELQALVKQYYPEIQDFSSSSIAMLLLELNASVSNGLNASNDRVFQETQLKYAQLKSSILSLAVNMGLNTSIIAKRGSVSLCDISFQIPVLGDKPDSSYYPTLQNGAQFVGAGKTFETSSNVDFSSNFDNLGNANRTIVANLDSNGIITSYNVTKREIVVNGTTNIYKKIITSTESIPFLEITLPDPDVLSIENIILLDGTNYSNNPTYQDFNNSTNKYYEVDNLAQQSVFVDNSNISSVSGIIAGKWINVTKKFVKEFTDNGFCVVRFGSGDSTLDVFKTGMIKNGITNQEFLNNYLLNTSLGEMLKANSTLFIQYRTGGGSSTNIGANTINSTGSIQISVNGSRQDLNTQVQRSITVNNPIQAVGGTDGLSIEQLRNLIKYNFSSQNRDVTLTDYLMQVYKMPGKYGAPFRTNAFKENNKVVIPILGLDANGKLSNVSSNLMKQNIANYLSNYRMINDYIEVRDGEVFDLAIDIEVYAGNQNNNTEIANNLITLTTNFFDINVHQIAENIYIGDLNNILSQSAGVINILGIKIYNKVGGNYSMNIIPQAFSDSTTNQINLINQTLYAVEDSMFQIRYPSKDIRVFLRKNSNS
jgi:hypothetical protein